jgi:hypothetical protein
MGPFETRRSPIWPEKVVASFMKAKSMVVGEVLCNDGLYQVRVLCGLRQVRPWASSQSVKSRAQLDGVCPAINQRGLCMLKSPRTAVGVRSLRL